MGEILYREAHAGDAETLAALFASAFTETFGHLYRDADLAAFLAGQQPPQWAEQLADPAIAIRIVEKDDEPVGFAKLGPLKLPVEAPRPAAELRQIYLLRPAQGSGAAVRLLEWVIEEARARGAQDLYLSVYTDNPRARRFYARNGFVEVGPYAFMVGDHEDADIIMRRPVD